MEILLITDTYLSSVPFGGEVIKTNNDGPSGGKSKQDQRKAEQSGESPGSPAPGLAVGNRASLESDSVDHQLTCFVLLLILNSHNTTFFLSSSALHWLRVCA